MKINYWDEDGGFHCVLSCTIRLCIQLSQEFIALSSCYVQISQGKTKVAFLFMDEQSHEADGGCNCIVDNLNNSLTRPPPGLALSCTN